MEFGSLPGKSNNVQCASCEHVSALYNVIRDDKAGQIVDTTTIHVSYLQYVFLERQYDGAAIDLKKALPNLQKKNALQSPAVWHVNYYVLWIPYLQGNHKNKKKTRKGKNCGEFQFEPMETNSGPMMSMVQLLH